ncbi:hypothetical protein [Aureimonas psammosilenae]|uniref:hypothetical protein n=1 Tax=Aureimonas psammosilenae TaxID=2495496 RepID=UPI00126095E0|nr:hypothetical protein [Aureimonas psammosilenae]
MRVLGALVGLLVAVASAALSARSLAEVVALERNGSAAELRSDIESDTGGIGGVLHAANRCGAFRESVAVKRALDDLGKANAAVDYDNWLAKLQAANAGFERALGCLPGDGALWAERALLMREVAVAPSSITGTLELSHRLSPGMSTAILPRVAAWLALPPAVALDPPATEARNRDIDLFVLQARPAMLASVIRNAPRPVSMELTALYRKASTKRVADVDYALHQYDLARPAPVRINPSSGTSSLFDLLNRPPELK